MSKPVYIIAMVRTMPDGSEAVSYFRDQMFGIPCFGQRAGAVTFPTKAKAKAAAKHWRGTFKIETVPA